MLFLRQLDEKFQNTIKTSRFGENFISNKWVGSMSEPAVFCWILIATSQFLCSLLTYDEFKSHILSVSVTINILVMSGSIERKVEIIDDITHKVKVLFFNFNFFKSKYILYVFYF